MAGKRLLLLSTSTVHGTGYLEHALPELDDFLGHRLLEGR